MDKPTQYSAQETEHKWYKHWLEKDYFSSVPDDREAFTIVIPPPNVTGILHMGHMLNNTIQDILIRRARQQNKNACWVPGTDHASIATEAKVVKMLAEKGIKKEEIGREEFLKHAFEWKEKYGGIILNQLQKLGASCDWDRTRFTMEEKLSKAVYHVFVDLHKKGKIYRGVRMTNWDPVAQTALSNEEVVFKDENSQLYYINYQIEGSDDFLTIATVRPETILGDTAVAVHPDDERFTHLHGKKVIIPIVGRAIPVITDKYVDMEFGTGCLKITPAHDPNDHEIGKRHKLETINMLNADGTVAKMGGKYAGMDRFVARKEMARDLTAGEFLLKKENYNNKVGRSERTNAVVEPRLTAQWFLDMKEFSATALKAVETGEVKFFPPHFYNMFNNWLNEDNVRDWCLSRQLWWGQQIPAYYYKSEVFVALSKEEALTQAQAHFNDTNIALEDLERDPDVLDTWFSSWLWPLSVFDGFESPEQLKYYYPTNVLVTGWDIIFFWVAKMIMSGYEWSEELLGKEHTDKHGKMPFKDVYFTGMVRDSKRKKMSKQLGNSPDALALIENYGADGVRFGMITSGSVGNDIIFDAPIDPVTKKVLNESSLCDQGQKFCNKMWNALRLIQGWEESGSLDPSLREINKEAAAWFENKLKQIISETEGKFDNYRLSDILMSLYNFIWGDFCSWYLEMIKPAYGQPIDPATKQEALQFFERLMTLLHPFMPFVTEEIWHKLKDRADGDDCIVSRYPTAAEFDEGQIKKIEQIKELITAVRDARSSNSKSPKDPLNFSAIKSDNTAALFQSDSVKDLLMKMANLSSLTLVEEEPADMLSFISGADRYFVDIVKEINVAEEIERLQADKARNQKLYDSASKKLSNEKFVAGAPPQVVENEKKKQADAKQRIDIINDELDKLS